MNVRQLLAAFDAWRDRGDDLVLATVYDTEGSTYSKAGAQMLIERSGVFRGMLSGGCLEGDLAERAAAALDAGEPQTATYDLGSSDDGLWGLGVGCDGLMRIFLQPLRAADGYRPFAAVADIYRGERPGAAATVIASTLADLPTGATRLCDAAGVLSGDDADWPQPAVDDGLAASLDSGEARFTKIERQGGTAELLFACVRPPRRVLVLGAGPDAEPIVRLMREMGWHITLQDHRPAYLKNGDFGAADRILCLSPDELAGALDPAGYDAAIVMSHHLQTDRRYLELLAGSRTGYVGLLGPVARRRRLLADLGPIGAALAPRVRGPAGLDLGGRGPAAIALSIVAEMLEHLEGRRGAPA